MHRNSDFQHTTLQQLGSRIASDEVSPVDCVRHSIETIDEQNGTLSAFVSHDAENALAEAKSAEREISQRGPRSPLHGIPFAVKDLFEVKGMVRTCGSRVHRAEMCTSDAHAVQLLRQAGAIVVGMTTLNEFAYGTTGINPVGLTARNPWNLERACGGSSAGSACAISAGMVWGALGTDTGGSVRIPAALCGITGLKPTFGLVSRQGIYPLCASFDHPGPMARSAWDCGLILASMAGSDRRDPATWHRPYFQMPSKTEANAVSGLRIGILRSLFEKSLPNEMASVFDVALAVLKSMGGRLVDVDLSGLDSAMDAWITISVAEAYHVHADNVRDHYEELSPDVAPRLKAGKDISLSSFQEAVRQREIFVVEMSDQMDDFDILVAPTAVIPAVSIKSGTVEADGEIIRGSEVLGKLTRLANLTGQPAISVPCGFTPDGLPAGLQMIGRWFGEADLILAADSFQRETGWHLQHPPGF